jgi:predicted nucleic acid-binding protein
VNQTPYLADTSALMRLLYQPDAARAWSEQLDAGLISVCAPVELELLYTARSAADRAALLEEVRDTFNWVHVPDGVFERATEVQAALTDRGTHRSAGPVDLLIAAAAEAHDLTLLHYDRDYERVAEVTGQQVLWLAAPGALN